MIEQTKDQTISNPVEAVVMLPCPFCGGDAEVMEYSTGFRVACVEFDCNCGTIDKDWTKKKAIEIWNKRAT